MLVGGLVTEEFPRHQKALESMQPSLPLLLYINNYNEWYIIIQYSVSEYQLASFLG